MYLTLIKQGHGYRFNLRKNDFRSQDVFNLIKKQFLLMVRRDRYSALTTQAKFPKFLLIKKNLEAKL